MRIMPKAQIAKIYLDTNWKIRCFKIMPTSHKYQINDIVELIVLTHPKQILDIGIGFGKYGYLAREYLDIGVGGGDEDYDFKKTQIDGIEVFTKYITPLHEIIYNNIYNKNALEVLPTLQIKYDLILVIDVLEHFSYNDGIKILEECKKRGRNIIISTPKDIGVQDDIFDNPFETHRFQWKKKHFDVFTNKFFIPNEYSIICYAGEDAERIKKILFKTRIKSKMKKYLPFLLNWYIKIKSKNHSRNKSAGTQN